jgi:cyclic pyranopterin phosphate synthase
MLKDTFGRQHDYLRISLTDVCNFRCTYCMPNENIRFMPAANLMQAEEIDAIASVFVKLGVKKIRLTGGEPLVRKDAKEIIGRLSKYPAELTLTTNGSLVHEFIPEFKSAGISSVNVSLDTLNKEKFQSITRRNTFDKVWENIHRLVDEGFHVKVNAVIMKGVNEDEIPDFIEWTRLLPIHVRFIEFMPFTGNQWDQQKLFSYREILEVVADKYSFIKMNDAQNETAKKYKLLGHEGTFAIISTMSAPFCSGCNRMRLTADGKMKNCLFSKGEVDILSAYRRGEDIVPLIKLCLADKKEALGGQFTTNLDKIDTSKIDNRSMINIGG